MWLVDFGEATERDASLFEAPFGYVKQTVKPERDKSRAKGERDKWWRLGAKSAEHCFRG